MTMGRLDDTMNTASQWRLSLARLLAEHYAAFPSAHAIFAGGSTARQQADRFSDIELAVIWIAAPTEQERASVVSRLNGDLHYLYPYDAHEQIWEDLFFVGRNEDDEPKSGCQVEVSHFLLPTLEASIDRVLRQYDADEGLHNLMAGILDGVPLLNAPLLDGWKDRLRHYPDALQEAVIRRHGIIDHFWRWEMLVARGDNRMELAALITGTIHHVLHLLLGLNRIYYGGFKWLDGIIDRLAIAPPDLGERIRRAYELPPTEAAAEVQGIVGQTFNLIEQHVPTVDVARFRQVFFYRRPQWEEPPPLAFPATPPTPPIHVA
jgi:hypothetical protein